MELVTGRLSLDEYEDEVAAVAEFFVSLGVDAVMVEFGFVCEDEQFDPMVPVPVSPALLASFVDNLEERDIYDMGSKDLFLKSDDDRVAFLFCEMADIHCYTDELSIFEAIRKRWAALYSESIEVKKETKRWRFLSGGPWQPFEKPKSQYDPPMSH